VSCFVHPIVHSAFVVGTIVRVSKIDRLKVLVVPLFLPTLVIIDEKVHFP
jgi:hypothetical protein